jgi:hypothetical protein
MRSHRMNGGSHSLANPSGPALACSLSLIPASPKRTPPAQSPPQNRPRSIPTPQYAVILSERSESKDLRLLVLRRHSGVARISVFALAVASRYAKPSGLALYRRLQDRGFNPWGMPSLLLLLVPNSQPAPCPLFSCQGSRNSPKSSTSTNQTPSTPKIVKNTWHSSFTQTHIIEAGGNCLLRPNPRKPPQAPAKHMIPETL